MRKIKATLLSVTFLVSIASICLFANAEEEIQKTYAKKEEVRLKLVLGDCQIKKSSDEKIHVHLVYSYEDNDIYEPIFEEKARMIYLREKYHGKNPRGFSRWTIAVPDDTEIDFRSATGNLSLSGITTDIKGKTGTGEIEISQARGEFDVSTGTGNIDLSDSEGEFDLSTGTGTLTIQNSKGNFDVASGTGDVEAYGLTIVDEGEFSSGTGDVEVSFPEGEDFSLYISSGTNDAVLHMKGKPIQGYFEFTAHARKGRINCPVRFDKEEEFWEGDSKYLLKSFTKGKKIPRVYIKTGTGKAELKR